MTKLVKLLALFCVVLVHSASAQVTIPDPAFRNALKVKYPSCFNASNVLDTTCAANIADTLITVSLSNVYDITGIHYFKKIREISYSGDLKWLPKLPRDLKRLSVGMSNVGTLTSLPEGLERLSISSESQLSSLPQLPSTLKKLECHTNIGCLPYLPEGLVELNIQGTNINCLPNKPAGIASNTLPLCNGTTNVNECMTAPVSSGHYWVPNAAVRAILKTQYPSCFNAANELNIACAATAVGDNLSIYVSVGDQLNYPASPQGIQFFSKVKTLSLGWGVNDMSVLPPNVERISGFMTGIAIISTLPNSVTYLNFTDNYALSKVIVLPPNLQDLGLQLTNISSLPELPSSLKRLIVSGNNSLTALPALPDGLYELWCSAPVSALPATLPPSLGILYCGGLPITSLPALPTSLMELECGGTLITSLPSPLPPNLTRLGCGNTQITSLPELPPSLTDLGCSGTLLSCVPMLPPNLSSLQVSAGVKCLPNKPSGIANNSLPLCNVLFNPNQCETSLARLAGYVFYDFNNNGTKDAGETPRAGVKISIPSSNLIAYSNENGFYEFAINTLGTVTANITLPTYYNTPQSSQSVTFTTGETIMRDFPIVSQGNIKDFKIALSNINTAARPGFPLHFRIKYENIGTIAGDAKVKFAKSALYNVEATSIAHTFSGDTLVWNLSNVPAGSVGYINVDGKLSATATLGSTQDFYASVNHNDVTDNVIADNRGNLALVVRGSYDPNDKQGTRTLTPTQVANGEFIDYTIRFQNTGTDTAFTVVVADTLANNLQTNTLEMISASHNARISLKGNIIYFEFMNILLPDSNVNEPRSHGFVKFRIKPKTNLVLGNTIQNKAAIYFDYNAPIITNTVVTTVAIPTGIAEKISNRLEVFPNPLEGEMLTIPNMRGASAKLLTLTGQELRSWTNIAEQISLQNVAAGMYLLEVSQNGQRRTAKVVVK
jgi:uncharacterized repeat protein (TIGR01451 family)